MDSTPRRFFSRKGGDSNARFSLGSIFAAVAMVGSLLLSAPAWSAVITLGTGAGCTLPDAILSANGDAEVGTCIGASAGGFAADTIMMAGENVDLAAALDPISDDLIIDGEGGSVSRGDGAPPFRIFDITGGITVEIKNLAISGGDVSTLVAPDDVGGGILCDAMTNVLTLSNVDINNNTAVDGGGLFTECETLIDKGSSISNNTALDLPIDMTPTTGDGGGVVVGAAATGDLIVEDSAINSNTAYFGGGLVVFAPVLVNIDNSTVSNNTAFGDAGGGAVFEDTGDVTINRSDFNGNNAKIAGGGILMEVDGGAAAKLTLNLSSVNNNTVNGDGPGGEEGAIGGGILIDEHEFEIANSTIKNNRAIDDDNTSDETRGGGLAVIAATAGSLVTQSVIHNNSATFIGGGIFVDDTVMSVENSRVTSNTAELGGGIAAVQAGDVTIEESDVKGNSASVDGGGLLATNGSTITLDATTVSGNNATENGGGMAVSASSPDIALFGADAASAAVAEGSTLSGNTAGVNGGGVFNDSSLLLSNTSTISGNSAGTGGGGIHTLGLTLAATSDFSDSTIASNSSTSGGGGFDQTDSGPGASTTLLGTLLALNKKGATPANCNDSLGGAAIVGFADSVSDDASCASVGTGLGAAADPVNLQPLAENGGLTQTHALPCNDATAAVDTGHANGAFDQRGAARPVDCGGAAEDTGAFEAGGTYIELANNNAPSTTVAADTNNVVLMDVSLTPRHGDVILSELEGSFCAPGHVLDVQQFTVVDDADGSGSLTPGDTTLGTLVNPTDELEFTITINMGDPTILENTTKNVLILANFDATIDQALAPSAWTQSAHAGPLNQTALLSSRAAQIAMFLVGLLLIASFVLQGEMLRKARVLLLAGFLGVAMTACSDDDDDGGDDKIGETPGVVVGENGVQSSANLLSSFCIQLNEVSSSMGEPTSNLPVLGATIKVNN